MTNAKNTDIIYRIDTIWTLNNTLSFSISDYSRLRAAMLVSITGNYPRNVSALWCIIGGSAEYYIYPLTTETGVSITINNYIVTITKTSANQDAVALTVKNISTYLF